MLLSCFTRSQQTKHGEASEHLPSSFKRSSVKKTGSRDSFDTVLRSQKYKMVIVNWSAKWCSLSPPADLLFIQVAKLHQSPGSGLQFVRVDMDKAEELMLEHRITMLPAFSIFVEGQRTEHFVGLESCGVLSERLQEYACSPLDDLGGASQCSQDFRDTSTPLNPTVSGRSSKSGSSIPSSASTSSADFHVPTAPTATRTEQKTWREFGRSNYQRFNRRKQALQSVSSELTASS